MTKWRFPLAVFMVLLVFSLAPVTTAEALTWLTARPIPSDLVNWSQLGTPRNPVASGSTFTSQGGQTGTLTGSGLYLYQVNDSIKPNFGSSDYFITNFNVADDPPVAYNQPIQISLSRPSTFLGAQITAFYPEPGDGKSFTANVSAYGPTGNFLGSHIFTGIEKAVADNTAIFAGAQDPGGIRSLVFSLSDNGPLGLNQSSLAPVPVPATILLFGTGLIRLISHRRRKA